MVQNLIDLQTFTFKFSWNEHTYIHKKIFFLFSPKHGIKDVGFDIVLINKQQKDQSYVLISMAAIKK